MLEGPPDDASPTRARHQLDEGLVVHLDGAPDERGFWPVLLAALTAAMLLARDRYTAGSAASRASDVTGFLRDPSIRAI